MKIASPACAAAYASAVLTTTFPFAPARAESAQPLEEVIVTGSYIQRSRMDQASPVETLTIDEVEASGYAQIGHYLRDLTYTANIDTVANVLATRGGVQDSNRTSFNLRGLGESSTLTLFDGRRTVNNGSVSDIMPDIALRTVDIVLDGGAATYGTDAVAGVVNLVPVESYDGMKFRAFYNQDQDGDTYEYKTSALFGKSSSTVDFVLAAEWSARPDPLRNFERPDYLRADNDTSISGMVPNAIVAEGTPDSLLPANSLDPACGTFNGTDTDDGDAGAFPSGVPLNFGPGGVYCSAEYGRWHDAARAQDSLTIFGSLTAHLNDYVSLKTQYSSAYQVVEFNTSGTTAERGSNLTYVVPGGPTPLDRAGNATIAHPNTPFDGNARMRDWRPFGDVGTLPSHIDSVGSQTPEYTYDYTNLAFGGEFRLGDTGWVGEAWYTNQSLTVNIDGYELSRERLGLALEGRGGPSGDQWINPFGTRDPRHPDFCDAPPGETGPGGCIGTSNTQEMVDWVHVVRDHDFSVEELQTVEGFVTGDVRELPAGNLAVAVGGQYRWNELTRRPSQAAAVGDAYGTSIVTPADPGSRADQEIYAAFGEVFVPILTNLEATLAVRYEDFTDFGFDATVPKISLLYTPREWLSLRASWGEGFLAPTLEELTVLEVPECAEQFGGEDPIRGLPLAGAQSCLNGSGDLLPEESEIFNVGFTLEPLEGLQISLDYQTVDYTDQIRQLSLIDTVEQDYAQFLAANGLSDAALAGMSQAERNALAVSWAAANPDSRVIRSGFDGEVQRVNRDSVNIAEVNVDVWDLRASYDVPLGDYGFLTANWSTTHYSQYDYIDLTGVRTDALGQRNDDTDIVPVMPEFKHYARLTWGLGEHVVSLVGKGYSDVDFDGTVGPGFGPGLGAEVPEEIKGQWVFNARYSYTFQNLYGGVMELAVGANNVFDKEAQPLPVQGGFETRLQDPFGRMLYMELNYSLE